MRFVADDLCGKPCLGYKIQVGVPEEAARRFGAIQEALRAGLPGPLYLCPPRSLHVSIFTLISARSTHAGKEAQWQSFAASSIADLEELCCGEPCIDLVFDRLRVTPSAVIALAGGRSAAIDAIRRHFTEVLHEAGLDAPSYDLTHVTLARFTREFTLPDETVATVAALPVSIDARVGAVDLVRELVYPALECDVIATVRLAQGL